MKDEHETTQTFADAVTSDFGALPFAPLKLDPSDYLDDMNEFNLSEEKKLELLQGLWNIMSMLVDIGYGVDAVQFLLPELFGNVATISNDGGEDDAESKSE